MLEGSALELTKSPMHERERYEDDVFYEEDKQMQSNIIIDLFTLLGHSPWHGTKATVGGSKFLAEHNFILYSLG